MKRSKSYKDKEKLVEAKIYKKEEALPLIKELSLSKFNGSIEMHINLNLNEKERSQPVRATVEYVHPFGETKKVLVFIEPASINEALEAGADYAGLDEYIKKIQGGWLDFDIAIATPSVISKVAVLGKILGTKGLMPNMKNGTVTTDIKSTVKGYKSGRANIKSDSFGTIHTLIGKVDNTPQELGENMSLVLKSILQSMNRTDNTIFKSIFLSPSMGPSLQIDIENLG